MSTSLITTCDPFIDPKSLDVVKGVLEERWVWSVCMGGRGGGVGVNLKKKIFLQNIKKRQNKI